jgi:ATP-dependent DNA helicase RecQ
LVHAPVNKPAEKIPHKNRNLFSRFLVSGLFTYLALVHALQVLKKYFGFASFRPMQEDIIRAVMEGRDSLVLMPTGGGKSVCYQVPALMLDGLTVVISPLIALMKDQVDALRLNGIEAAYLNSSLSGAEQEALLRALRDKKMKLLYIAPERLQAASNDFTALLKSCQVSLFAIDEAHCISHWGHDFRPDYLLLSRLKENFPGVPLVALTATADKLTRNDIVQKLGMKEPGVFVSSFNRGNIRYIVEDKENHFNKLTDFLNAHEKDSGIIYCLSRQQTEELAVRLSGAGYEAGAYHAGLDSATRAARQEQFKRDELRIMVATIAFGMGIDKSNVRFVIHTTLPKNIESYYQETGRAGRDGLPAQAVLFYSAGDLFRLKSFVSVEGNPEQTRIYRKKLSQMSDFCASRVCRRKYLLNYFDEDFTAPCGNCDVCLSEGSVPLFDGTVIAQKALSAIVRLKERFGAGYVINFLKGSGSKKIFDEHRYLPTFGKGAEYTSDAWKSYFRQFLDQGLLESYGEFSALRVTGSGKEVLYGGRRVELFQPREKKVAREERKSRFSGNQTEDFDKTLFQNLKILRREIAAREGVPPYIVFPDNTLAELSRYLPLRIEHLPNITGFGKIKIEKYGEAFLAEISEYCKQEGRETRMNKKLPLAKVKGSAAGGTPASDTKKLSFEMYLSGIPIQEIARKRKLSESTITGHLLHFVETGDINVLKFIGKDKLAEARRAMDEHGAGDLGLLKEILGESFSYTEIKAAIHYQNKISRTWEAGKENK